MEKALVLLSGGIDSAVALAASIEKYGKDNVSCLTFNYGQRNSNEIKYSRKLAKYYKVNNTVLNISNLFKYSNSSLLKHSTLEITKDSYEEQVIKKNKVETDINVPFRNGLFLSIASSFALSNNIDVIVYGIHLEEGIVFDLYPDCSDEFNINMNNAIKSGTGGKVRIEAPFSKITKSSLLDIGIKLKVPFELTWTCYNNLDKPCGYCNSCKDRIKAFSDNNYKDPYFK